MSLFSRAPFGVDPYSGATSSGAGTCCCGDVVTEACCDCDSVPLRYSFSVAGVSNNVLCSRCNIYNGDFVLTFRSAGGDLGCVWTNGDEYPGSYDVCCDALGNDADQIWMLECDDITTGFWTLLPSFTCVSGTIPVYTKSRATWSCLGSNSLTLVTSPTVCDSWPASITLTPV